MLAGESCRGKRKVREDEDGTGSAWQVLLMPDVFRTVKIVNFLGNILSSVSYALDGFDNRDEIQASINSGGIDSHFIRTFFDEAALELIHRKVSHDDFMQGMRV